MRLVFATEDFVHAHRPRPGFPLILDDDMTPMQPFHDFLRHQLLEKGKLLDIKTWDAYGRHLWDFANFLQANGLAWNQPFASPGSSVMGTYHDWQAKDLALSPRYRNKRLRFVQRFYEWARDKGMIQQLPYCYDDVTGRSNLIDQEWDEEPAFLTAEQIKMARKDIRAMEHGLAFDLMVQVGLRSIETRTFPLKYVFDPTKRPWLPPGRLIEVRLDPRDMDIKFNKPRTVHVPYRLMQRLHAYTEYERNLRRDPEHDPGTLLLTAHGNAYSKGSLTKNMRDLGDRAGFRIVPLMLRHSYAIHTLLLLRSIPNLKIEPLLYLRNRLGHKSVETTEIYLHQIERLVGAEAMAMIDEFDQLYGMTPSLRDLPEEKDEGDVGIA